MLPFLQNLLLALLCTTAFNYILSFTASVLLFFFYAKPDGCLMNKLFISINGTLCVVASVVSVLQKVQVVSFDQPKSNCRQRCLTWYVWQERQPRSGLLQSSIITLYTMFLTWSAMSNEPGTSGPHAMWLSSCCGWFFWLLRISHVVAQFFACVNWWFFPLLFRQSL